MMFVCVRSRWHGNNNRGRSLAPYPQSQSTIGSPPMLSCLRIPYLTTRPAVCQQQCLGNGNNNRGRSLAPYPQSQSTIGSPPMLSCLRIPYLTTRPAVCQQHCLRFRFGRRLLVSRRASPPQTPTFRAAFRMRVKASAHPMACLGRVFPRHRLRYSLLHPSLARCLARSLSGTHPHAHTCRHTFI